MPFVSIIDFLPNRGRSNLGEVICSIEKQREHHRVQVFQVEYRAFMRHDVTREISRMSSVEFIPCHYPHFFRCPNPKGIPSQSPRVAEGYPG